MNEDIALDNDIARVVDLLEQIKEVNKMITVEMINIFMSVYKCALTISKQASVFCYVQVKHLSVNPQKMEQDRC